MKRDIIFPTEVFVFSYRVGGILIRNGSILLQRHRGEYAIIGGHVAAMETTQETLRREYQEEIHADISVDRLFAVGEVFFPWGDKPCHQVCLYYKISLVDESQIPLEGVFHGFDELGGKRIDLDFCWVPLEELQNGLSVYPLELIPIVLEDSKETKHFISREV